MILSPDDIQHISDDVLYVEIDFDREKERFLSDHIIGGECLVPGAIMLELMAECGSMILPGTEKFCIEQFRILRRIKIDPERLLKIFITQDPEGLRIRICTDFIKNGRVVRKNILHAESVYKNVFPHNSMSTESFADESLQCFCVNKETLYTQELMQGGLFFQGLGEKICFSEKFFMGKIEIANQQDSFIAEPLLLDNCFQISHLRNRMYDKQTVLPVGIDRFCFYEKSSSSAAYCYGVFEGYEGAVSVCSILVSDESDRVVFVASGVRQQNSGTSQLDLMQHLRKADGRFVN